MVIYKITNKINGKVYIGQTVNHIKRWSAHCCHNVDSAIHNAIIKYGKDNFIFEIIAGANSKSELNYLEEHYIYMNNCIAPHGYNLTNGGPKYTHSNESIEKIKTNRIQPIRKPLSEEARQKIRLSRIGKKTSDETKKKMSLIRKGRKGHPCSEETKLKISIKSKGKAKSKEHCKNMSIGKKRAKNEKTSS